MKNSNPEEAQELIFEKLIDEESLLDAMEDLLEEDRNKYEKLTKLKEKLDEENTD